jgi:DNA-directed RNA polymerase subunit M/transcription elongation factor TFIIS
MHFCDKCENMYYIKISEEPPNNLVYYCRNCGNETSDLGTDSFYVSRNSVNDNAQNHTAYLNPYIKYDKTLPRVSNIPCPNENCVCNKDKKVQSEVIVYRYDDENLKYMYICVHCDKTWTL